MKTKVTYQHLLACLGTVANEATGGTLTASLEGVLVGVLNLELSEPGAYVRAVYVHPEYYNSGIGTELLNRAKGLAAVYSKTSLVLSVHDKNEGAQRLYKRLGYIPFAVVYEDYTQYILVL